MRCTNGELSILANIKNERFAVTRRWKSGLPRGDSPYTNFRLSLRRLRNKADYIAILNHFHNSCRGNPTPTPPGLFHSQENKGFVGVVRPLLPVPTPATNDRMRVWDPRAGTGARPLQRMKQPCLLPVVAQSLGEGGHSWHRPYISA
jgi:hypothetical protein